MNDSIDAICDAITIQTARMDELEARIAELECKLTERELALATPENDPAWPYK